MKRLLMLALAVSIALAGIPGMPALASDGGNASEQTGGNASGRTGENASEQTGGNASGRTGGNPLRLWYDEPAPISSTTSSWWQEVVLAIGNGHMGGMVFGGVERERLHFNEKTLWTGSPNNGDVYGGGNRATVWDAESMEAVRSQLDDKSEHVFGYPNITDAYSNLRGNGLSGTYQDFGDVYLDFHGLGDGYENYIRDLDMNTGVASVQFTSDGVEYSREHFASHPDDVMVSRLSASAPGKISFTASIAPYTTFGNPQNVLVVASDGSIVYTGNLSNGLEYVAELKIANEGGTLTSNDDGTVTVEGADAATLYFACGTDYENQMTRMPHFRTGEGRPTERVAQTVDNAAAKGFEPLKESHVADHSELFSRVSVDLSGGYVPEAPTDELVTRYQRSMFPERPYVDTAREGGTPTASVSGQVNSTYSGARIVDGNNTSIWISNDVADPYAIIALPGLKTFDMLQLACVTPEYIVEYDSDPGAEDNWTAFANVLATTELEYEFHDVSLTFDPVTTDKIRVRWDSERTGLGNKGLKNRTLGELRAYDTSRPAQIAPIATAEEQRALEVMAYQMGRYMTIAASRAGDPLPTNLCGVWLIGPAVTLWNADFHFNINVQMNYWPTLSANLAESETVFNDYIASDSIRLSGRRTAEYYAGSKFPGRTWEDELGEETGFMVHVQNGPYGHTSPGNAQEWGWNPTGSIWALQSAYDYYLYTLDVDYLREKIYPMMREMAMFWYDYLWYSDYQGRWVVAPSHSPEQGPTVNGSTFDQSLVWQHFEYTIEAAEILGVDADKIPMWREKQAGLDPIQIGDDGQVKEWYEESAIGMAKAGDLAEVAIPNWRAGISPTNSIVAHRHPSHLMGLYPGTLISKDSENAVVEAARVSLNERGFGATSWGKSHKINAWARVGQGEKEAYYMMRSMVGGGNGGFMKNLFSSHGNNGNGTINYTNTRIFQIDGNFGYSAGFNEALLQSQLGYVQFLPAIYTPAWNSGSVKGLVARGNFVVDMDWTDGVADSFAVTSRAGAEFTGEYAGLSKFSVKTSAGEPVSVNVISDDRISFATAAGETYTLTPPGKASVGVYAADKTDWGDKVVYTFAADELANANLIDVTVTVDGAALDMSDPVLAGVGDWTNNFGKGWDGSRFNFIMGLMEGKLAAGKEDFATLTFDAAKLGDATVTITAVNAQIIVEGEKAESVGKDVIINPEQATTNIYSVYDVDDDGVVGTGDLSLAFWYYQSAEGDDNWSGAVRCDVDGNGKVDMTDLVAIYANFGIGE